MPILSLKHGLVYHIQCHLTRQTLHQETDTESISWTIADLMPICLIGKGLLFSTMISYKLNAQK